MAHESYSSPPEMTISPDKDYYATFWTEKGPICIKLFADKAPGTVNNFVFLAREGYFDGTTFHRVIKEALVTIRGRPRSILHTRFLEPRLSGQPLFRCSRSRRRSSGSRRHGRSCPEKVDRPLDSRCRTLLRTRAPSASRPARRYRP